MPCDSSHMEANGLEVELSRLLMLLEEFRTGRPVNRKSDGWDGYHKQAYGYGQADLRKRADAATAELCGKLTACEDVTRYSLEMQIWWRDHQKADNDKRNRKDHP